MDAVVCDPPYGLSFMGKGWDHEVPGAEYWSAILGAAKPGAHLVAFGGTRQYHRLACAIEDAGWEIRDCLMWLYGSGFPKSHDVSKAIDKAAGAEREVVGRVKGRGSNSGSGSYNWNNPDDESDRTHFDQTAPATDDAKRWDGWGTALKPAWEPIILARKPLAGTVAANVCEHGTGAINVDGCRVETTDCLDGGTMGGVFGNGKPTIDKPIGTGRWPANLILDGHAGAMVDERSSGASRFFYSPKADRSDRDCGNNHPTVKPVDLMRWLCRLVTPPGGTILDPFTGSGSTGVAANREGFNFIGCELNDEYAQIARDRIAAEDERAGLFATKSNNTLDTRQ